MKKYFLFIIALLLFISSLSFTEEATDLKESPDYSGMITKMDAYIDELMKKHEVAGLSIALVDGQKTVWQKGFGYADVEKEIAAGEHTIFNYGSVSKLFTGLAIMQLVEEGKIDLDAQLSDYLPEFSIRSRFPEALDVTIRSMLSHHSGLPSDCLYRMVNSYSENSVEYFNNYESRLLEYLETTHLAYRKDYTFSYSNIAYNLLGFVVQRVSEKPLADYVKENILLPLGMENASISPYVLREDVKNLMAMPHIGMKPGKKYLWMAHGAGALNAGVSDMTGFIKMVLGKGSYGDNQVVSEETLQHMLTPQNEENIRDGSTKLGLSFFLNDPAFSYGGKTCGHGGGMIHYYSDLKILLEHELGVVLAVNSDSGEAIVQEIARTVLEEALLVKTGLKKPAPEEEETAELTGKEMQELEGNYACFGYELVKIRVKNNKARLLLPPLNVKLSPLAGGWMKPETSVNFLKDIRIKVETVEGEKLLFIKTPDNSTYPFGKEVREKEPAKIWKKRTGTYYFSQKNEEGINFHQTPFILKIKNGFLCLISKNKQCIILEPISENECITQGLGRNAGETMYFEKEEGKDIIRWSGYILKKK